jgi:hypothetical protein
MTDNDPFGRPPRRGHGHAVPAIFMPLPPTGADLAFLALRHVMTPNAEATIGSQLTSHPSSLPLDTGTRS